MAWQYDLSVHRFRDLRTGRFLSPATAIDLRDRFQERRRADVDALTRRLADKTISVQEWEREMTQALRDLFHAQYAYGRGGLNAMTAADYAEAHRLVEEQRVFLRAFTEDIAAGRLSEAQIGARAKLYYGASRQAYERGRSAAFGVQLPAYPGQGSPCGSNCACYWALVDKPETVEATWRRTAQESCSVCKRRARDWSPLVISKSGTGRLARLFRAVA